MNSTKRHIAATTVIRTEGSSHVGLRVFCGRRAESVPLDECRTCSRCEEIAGDTFGESSWVTCETTEGEGRIGSVVHGNLTCVENEMSVTELTALMIQRELSLLFVVNREGALVGVVRDVDLLRARRNESSPRARDVMSRVDAVCESDAVRQAIIALASKRVRQAAVVTREGLLVGIVRDVDALARLNAIRANLLK